MKFFAIALLGAIVVSSAAGQGDSHFDVWSANREIKDQHIKLVPWGSGNIAQATDVANDGVFSIRVSTHNYFQGGIMNFATPVDLSKSYTDPNNLLQITVRTADEVILKGAPGTGPAAGAGRGPGGFGGPGGPGGPGGGAAGGFGGGKFGGGGQGGQGGPGGPGGFGGGRFGGGGQGQGAAGTPSETITPKLTRIRMIITTSDGKKSEAYLPLPVSANTPWHSIAIPLTAISGFSNTNKDVQSIAFSGDATTTYYIGDIRVVHDATPITGEMNAKTALDIALGDTVEFKGSGQGGSTVVQYSWCFDSANGFFEDARGADVKHRFRKPGNYVVTLKVSDYYGAKKPFLTTVNVTVNP